jgi:hypothetical protein
MGGMFKRGGILLAVEREGSLREVGVLFLGRNLPISIAF